MFCYIFRYTCQTTTTIPQTNAIRKGMYTPADGIQINKKGTLLPYGSVFSNTINNPSATSQSIAARTAQDNSRESPYFMRYDRIALTSDRVSTPFPCSKRDDNGTSPLSNSSSSDFPASALTRSQCSLSIAILTSPHIQNALFRDRGAGVPRKGMAWYVEPFVTCRFGISRWPSAHLGETQQTLSLITPPRRIRREKPPRQWSCTPPYG